MEKFTSFEALGQKFREIEDFDLIEESAFVPEKDQKYSIVSTVAYLIGIRDMYFGPGMNFDESIKKKLSLNKNARILRNACLIRNSLENKFTKILVECNNGRSVLTMSEYIPQEAVRQLTTDGVRLSQKSNMSPFEYLVELNGIISDRINNCKSVFPEWINWEYVKEIFLMPDGRSEWGVKEAGNLFRENYDCYPYHAYINWPMPHGDGNVLLNDKKFVTLLYMWNYDEFTDFNRVVDVSERIKGDIYDFIGEGEKISMIVDCENSDVYNIINMLRSLEWEHLAKISRITLVNDTHTNLGWQELDKCTDIPIDHIMTQRVMESKSLVDGTLIARVFTEYYEENVDSFILLSSDSDFWTIIDSLRAKAKFLVMVEHMKCGPDYKEVLADAGVLYCYLDDFNSGEESEQMKNDILLRTINGELKKKIFNLKDVLDECLLQLRINMDPAHKEQFYKKYLKTLQVCICDEGNVVLVNGGKR